MFELILAAAVSTAPPSPQPRNPCIPAETCRYVDEFPIKDAQGAVRKVVVKRWLPYLAGGRLTLFPGEVVSVTLADTGPIVTAAASLTAEDRDQPIEAQAMELQKKTEAAGQEMLTPVQHLPQNPVFAADKDSLRVAFLQASGGTMMLRIASGYDRPLNYRAAINRPGRGTAATSVCSVLGMKIGVETWPPPIVAIELTDLQLQPAGMSAVCR